MAKIKYHPPSELNHLIQDNLKPHIPEFNPCFPPGIPDDKVFEVHGSFRSGKCMKCGATYTEEEVG